MASASIIAKSTAAICGACKQAASTAGLPSEDKHKFIAAAKELSRPAARPRLSKQSRHSLPTRRQRAATRAHQRPVRFSTPSTIFLRLPWTRKVCATRRVDLCGRYEGKILVRPHNRALLTASQAVLGSVRCWSLPGKPRRPR